MKTFKKSLILILCLSAFCTTGLPLDLNRGIFIMENEIWKNIIGYEQMYDVSNLGNVRSIPRTKRNRSGGKSNLSGRILKQGMMTAGYKFVVFCRDCKKENFGVHRLVATAFIPNPENKLQVNHINGIKTDNRVENLEWCSDLENKQHAKRTGLSQSIKGSLNKQAKLTEIQVIEIISIPLDKTNKEVADIYNVGIAAIWNIRNNKRWKHIQR